MEHKEQQLLGISALLTRKWAHAAAKLQENIRNISIVLLWLQPTYKDTSIKLPESLQRLWKKWIFSLSLERGRQTWLLSDYIIWTGDLGRYSECLGLTRGLDSVTSHRCVSDSVSWTSRMFCQSLLSVSIECVASEVSSSVLFNRNVEIKTIWIQHSFLHVLLLLFNLVQKASQPWSAIWISWLMNCTATECLSGNCGHCFNSPTLDCGNRIYLQTAKLKRILMAHKFKMILSPQNFCCVNVRPQKSLRLQDFAQVREPKDHCQCKKLVRLIKNVLREQQ